MTIMEQMILKAIKEHNAERDDAYMMRFNKGIKFLCMGQDMKRGGHGDTKHIEYPNAYKDDYTVWREVHESYMRLIVRCTFKPEEKYSDNVVLYEVMLYSNGTIGIYFDGTEYLKEEVINQIRGME